MLALMFRKANIKSRTFEDGDCLSDRIIELSRTDINKLEIERQ
jgi:hypothetical protein